MTLESHPLHKEYLNAKLWMTSKTGDEFLAEVDRRVSAEGSTEKKTRIKCNNNNNNNNSLNKVLKNIICIIPGILKMVILASLYYDFFCANKVCANITNKLESIASVLGITTNEKKVFRFFNNGWYNVGDLDLDDFQSLFSRQKRETGNRDVKELSRKKKASSNKFNYLFNYLFVCLFIAMFVNVIIYTLGYYPGTAHTYPKAFNISSLNNTSSPGSTHRGHSVNPLKIKSNQIKITVIVFVFYVGLRIPNHAGPKKPSPVR